MTKKQFEQLRKNKDYRELGRLFWNGFLFLHGQPRKLLSAKWKKLTPREKYWCEFY